MINDENLEFLEDEHLYLYNGVIIPSVSELLRFNYPDAYSGIPEYILNEKAKYGTKVHGMIEDYVAGKYTLEDINKMRMDPYVKIAVQQFEKLRKEHDIKIKDMEQMVTWEGRYAGRYDIRTTEDILMDIKTTEKFHEEWLEFQEGHYYMAAGIQKEKAYCLWLPKGKPGKLIETKVWTYEQCKECVERYEKRNTEE